MRNMAAYASTQTIRVFRHATAVLCVTSHKEYSSKRILQRHDELTGWNLIKLIMGATNHALRSTILVHFEL